MQPKKYKPPAHRVAFPSTQKQLTNMQNRYKTAQHCRPSLYSLTAQITGWLTDSTVSLHTAA